LPKIESSEQQLVKKNEINELIIGLIVIIFLGDHSFQTLAWLGEIKTYMDAAAIALVSIPLVVSEIDG
jgi:hypothetical protein